MELWIKEGCHEIFFDVVTEGAVDTETRAGSLLLVGSTPSASLQVQYNGVRIGFVRL